MYKTTLEFVPYAKGGPFVSIIPVKQSRTIELPHSRTDEEAVAHAFQRARIMKGSLVLERCDVSRIIEVKEREVKFK